MQGKKRIKAAYLAILLYAVTPQTWNRLKKKAVSFIVNSQKVSDGLKFQSS